MRPKNQSYSSYFLSEIWLGSDILRAASIGGTYYPGLYTAYKDSAGNLSVSHGCLLELVGDRIYGNLSTNPAKDQPGSVDVKAIKFFYSIAPEKSIHETQAPWPVGKPFKGNDHSFFSHLRLDGRTNYVILAAPGFFGPDWQTPGVLTGRVTPDIGALFESMHSHATAWLTVLDGHTVDKGQAVLNNITALRDYLPTLPTDTHPIADPFCRFEAIPPMDQEGALLEVCTRLTERLQQFLPSTPTVPQTVGGNLSSPANNDDSTLGGNIAPPAVTDGAPSDEVARRVATHSLVHGRISTGSDGSVSFSPPEFRPDTLRAISHQKKAIASVALSGCLMAELSKNQGSRDMFLRLCSLDTVSDKVFLGWTLHCKGVSSFYKFDTLEDFKTCNAGLTLLCFLPDTKSSAGLRRAANSVVDARMNEEFMGEISEKMSKLPTSALLHTNFSSLRTLQVVVANLSLLASVFVTFDATTNPADAPLLHALGFQIGDCLHDKKFNDWFFIQEERTRMAFLYWLFSSINTILQSILQLGTNETHIQAILLAMPELIDGSPWLEIGDDIALLEASILSYVKGTATVPENHLFLSSDYHIKSEEKKQAQLLASLAQKSPSTITPNRGGLTPSKRKHAPFSPPVDGDYSPRKEGELRWDAAKAKGIGWKIPPPPHVPGARSLCLMHVVESIGCLRGKNCNFSHPAKLSDWDPKTVAIWVKHVKATPGLSWHPDVAAELAPTSLTLPTPLARTQAVLAHRHRQAHLPSSAQVTHVSRPILRLPSTKKSTHSKSASFSPRLAAITGPSPPHSASPSDLLSEYNLHHFGIQADGPSNLTGESLQPPSSSSPSLYNALLGVSTGSSIPSWRLRLPSHAALLRTPFGLPSLNHSFTQEASFDTIIFSVFKYGVGFLSETDFDALCSVNILLPHFAKMMVALTAIDFRSLREPDPFWSLCESIPRLKELDFLALLFHYDLHLSAAVRFLGSKYLGGHRNITQICAKLAPHVDAETIAHYKRIMTLGCPNHFNASTTRSNSELYRLLGNDSSIVQHQSLVRKNMLKEYKHNFAFPLPVWMGRYLRHSFFTPQHIHLHPSKPPRQIFNAKERPTPDAVAVNNMTSTPFGSELECRYGDVLPRVFRRLWNLRITYPNRDIVLHCNDVKSCFRQIKHHPDVVGAFSFVVFQHVWIQIGCTFGSDFSPANWEGVRRTIEQLARGLFDDASLRAKHRKYLDKLQWDVSLDSSKTKQFVPA